MIDKEQWQQVSALLDQALALPARLRPAWLAELRLRDATLAEQVLRVLSQPGAAEADASTTGRQDTSAAAGGDTTQPLQPWRDFARHLGPALIDMPATGAAALHPGRRLGAWALVRALGSGGMGEVWLARRADGLFEAQAAIKLLRSDLPAAGLAARFARERAVLARLNHPAVARLLDAGIAEDGQAFLVLEYVPGHTLAAHVRKHLHTVGQRVALLLRVAEAVEYAHAQLIAHRDLKPSNVMVTPSGEPKLLDFGIAGLLDGDQPVDTDLTRQAGRGLTLSYAAPEQILGRPIGTAADVFSLGVVLYELLSGELPFAPRHSDRLAIEKAVLHDEPRRLQVALDDPDDEERNDPSGPGQPIDAQRALGDLEAVLAKALRKDPAARYANVRAFTDDLQRWQRHQPVSVRRDDWRHRSGLWLRRNALLAGATALVLASLGAGLVAATWQWRRAEAAARQSDQVTSYLGELLASANPSHHGGQWPNVLQLLDSSRQSLPGRFADDPQTKMRLLRVLADTYHALNRFDASFPLYDELVGLSRQQLGAAHALTLEAELDRARTWQVQGAFDKTIAALEPLQALFSRTFGASSEERWTFLHVLSTSYARAGRLADADRLLAEAGRLTDRLFRPGDPHWLSHQNHLQVLRVSQGRPREGLQALLRTEPYWADLPLEYGEMTLTLPRNVIAVQLRLAEYDRIEQRVAALLRSGDRLRGPGNDFSAGLRVELAHYFTATDQHERALQQREQNLALALAAKVDLPASLVTLHSSLLLARARAHAAPPAQLRAEARSQLARMDAQREQLGYRRSDAWIDIARVGLLLDDAALAAEAVGRLAGDAGLHLERDEVLASRVAQLDGELARLQGDLPRSQQRLRQRLALFDRPGISATDKQVLPGWAAALDLAYTQVLAGDAQAAQTLAQAATRRPPGVAPGHTLDFVQAWLQARLVHGRDDATPVQAALQALLRHQHHLQATPGLASLAGALS